MHTKKAYNINREESEETPSFHLSFESQAFDASSPTFRHSSNSLPLDPELFEFSFVSNTPLKTNRNGIVFCGKLIEDRDSVDSCDQNRNLFPSSSANQFNHHENDLGSVSFVNSKSNSSSSIRNFRSQSVKQHKALIGVTKIPQRMELSDLKRRQSKGNRPLFMFPPTVDADDSCGVGSKRCRLWSLLKPLRCRDHTFSSLSKASLGYITNL